MTLVRTEELEGAALDWAVAKAVGHNVEVALGGSYGRPNTRWFVVFTLHVEATYSPSRLWGQGGPLMDEFRIDLSTFPDGNFWATQSGLGVLKAAEGSTRLEAICRLVARLKFPDGVEVPDELC